MSTDIVASADQRMGRAIEAMERDFTGLRTGRASTSLVERIHVDYYGTETPLNQLAGISVPEAHQIVIQPWDRSVLGAIEKAILKSELGITPQNDGKVIRLTIPPLSEQRRKQLVSQARERAEAARVAIRNIRRDANKAAEALDIPDDDFEKLKRDIDDLTKDYTKQVDDQVDAKTKDLMEV